MLITGLILGRPPAGSYHCCWEFRRVQSQPGQELLFHSRKPTPSWAAVGRENEYASGVWPLAAYAPGAGQATCNSTNWTRGPRLGTWMGGTHGWDFWEDLGRNGAGGYNQISLCTHAKFWKILFKIPLLTQMPWVFPLTPVSSLPTCSQELYPYSAPLHDLTAITETECGFSGFPEQRTCCGHWLLSYPLAWKWGAYHLTP